MLKKTLLALTLSVTSMMSFAADFVEGRHYVQISNAPASEQAKVTEFFSFLCGHCYQFETRYLPIVKPELDSDIQFETKHVQFRPSAHIDELRRALAVIHQTAGKDKMLTAQMMRAVFETAQAVEEARGEHHHHNHEPNIKDRNDLYPIFAKFGIDQAKYDALADSKVANEKLALWLKQEGDYQIPSVPSFIVNDKYMLVLDHLKTVDEMSELINYLADKK